MINNLFHKIRIWILFIVIWIPSLGFSQNVEKSKLAKIQPEEFLKIPLDDTLPIISKMNKEEAAELATQLRQVARKSYPEIDQFYFLISHLEEIQAIEKEQKRLESLLWVYGLGYLLFTGFLAYILISQRKLIQVLNKTPK